tara:strand:+ start:317 stop:523 length:207 start_codon:yes stop_codon:yes gene_type:complete
MLWVELMRLSPGARLGLHRHTGEIHALNLQGQRRLCTTIREIGVDMRVTTRRPHAVASPSTIVECRAP